MIESKVVSLMAKVGAFACFVCELAAKNNRLSLQLTPSSVYLRNYDKLQTHVEFANAEADQLSLKVSQIRNDNETLKKKISKTCSIHEEVQKELAETPNVKIFQKAIKTGEILSVIKNMTCIMLSEGLGALFIEGLKCICQQLLDMYATKLGPLESNMTVT